MMNSMNIESLEESLAYIRGKTRMVPQTAVILGSGLSGFADLLEDKIKVSTNRIPHYPASTVEGHPGVFVFGTLDDIPVLAVQGRTHFYEGYTITQVTYVVRILAALGIQLLIVTNAAGAVNSFFQPGDLMLITDHVNHMYRNPLRGPLPYGREQFPDMSDPYNSALHPFIEEIALQEGIILKKGILLASTGPSYETAAEIRMIRKIKADAVSMSTIPEVIEAKREGIKVIGISCITNKATGMTDRPLDHGEVTQIARTVTDKFIKLVSGIIHTLKQ